MRSVALSMVLAALSAGALAGETNTAPNSTSVTWEAASAPQSSADNGFCSIRPTPNTYYACYTMINIEFNVPFIVAPSELPTAISPIPEPSTLITTSAGLAALLLLGKRMKREVKRA